MKKSIVLGVAAASILAALLATGCSQQVSSAEPPMSQPALVASQQAQMQKIQSDSNLPPALRAMEMHNVQAAGPPPTPGVRPATGSPK